MVLNNHNLFVFDGGKMKVFIKENIVVDEFEDNIILTKENEKGEIDYNNAIVLENVAKYIFNLIKDGKDTEKIAQSVAKDFDVELSTAKADLENFVNQLVEADIAYVR